jgi:N6-L-threonylcarbamoyladenine synthase
VGRSFARGLADAWDRPLIGIDHVRAHLYAAFIGERIRFPFVGLVVSGGHTSLYRVSQLGKERLLGSTRDDAAGEAFDKVAKILGLGYPGGPAVEAMARKGRANAIFLRCGCGPGPEFSFSGIKTAVLYKVQELTRQGRRLSPSSVRDFCASFQEAVVSDLVAKAVHACRQVPARDLAVGGGVAFNERLREALAQGCRDAGVRLHIAAKEYCLDNAAMIASLAAR